MEHMDMWMQSKFQKPPQLPPWKWLDVGIASIGNLQEAKLETHFRTWSI